MRREPRLTFLERAADREIVSHAFGRMDVAEPLPVRARAAPTEVGVAIGMTRSSADECQLGTLELRHARSAEHCSYQVTVVTRGLRCRRTTPVRPHGNLPPSPAPGEV